MSLPEWDKVYKSGRQKSKWPWSDLISLINIYLASSIKEKRKLKILEIGCGYGANIPFFAEDNIFLQNILILTTPFLPPQTQ